MADNYDLREALDEAQKTIEAFWLDRMELTEDVGSAMMYTESRQTDSLKTKIHTVGPSAIFQEWQGEKQFSGNRIYNFEPELKVYHAGIALRRMDVRYDPSSIVDQMINRFLRTAPRGVGDTIFDALVSNSGEGPAGFDGVNLISTSHPHGPSGGTNSNKTTDTLSFSSYDAGMQAMQEHQNEKGQSFNADATLLMCGPKYRKTALEIAKATNRKVAVDNTGAEASSSVVDVTNVENVFQGEVDVFINKKLTGTQDDYAYLIDTSEMPMLWIVGREPEVIDKLDMRDDNRYFRDELLWSIEFDAVPTAGFWPSIYGFIS